MFVHFYIWQNQAFIPTAAITNAGFFFDIEPVTSLQLSDTKLFIQVISRYMSKGNPRIPTPSISNLPKGAVLKYAKQKSWSKFEKTGDCWQITEDDKSYTIEKLGRLRKGGWGGEPVLSIQVPKQSSLMQNVAERVVEEVLKDLAK